MLNRGSLSLAGKIRPSWILLAAWFLCLAYAYPGYLNWDSGEQLYQLRQGALEDWHPPLMATYWELIEVVVKGPVGMLFLQTGLFLWGLYAALRQRLGERTSAVLAALLLLFPPILTPMAAVWKDAQMAGFLLAGVMLAVRRPLWARLLGLGLLFLGTGVRDNAPAALPFLCLWIGSSWGLRSRIVSIAVAVGLCFGLTAGAGVANRAATDIRTHPWYRSVAIMDIVGTVAYARSLPDDYLLRVLGDTDLRQRKEIQDRARDIYIPRVWFGLVFSENGFFVAKPTKPQRLARARAWYQLVSDFPGAYVTHRWAVMKEVLGLTKSDPWEPVCQSFAAWPDHLERVSHNASHSWLQKKLGKWFLESWSKTLAYRVWVYALLGIILLAYALVRRDPLVVAFAGSGLLYEASYFLGAAAPDFRYSHWLIACSCLGAVLVFAERLRAGLAAPGERRGAGNRSPA